MYRQVSNIRSTLAGDEIVDHSDVVGASPVCAIQTTSCFLNQWCPDYNELIVFISMTVVKLS